MLIARAPVRISFAGGGSDLPAFYEKYGGCVISTTINKYFYVILNVNAGDLQITSSDYRTFYQHNGHELPLWDGDLRLPRAVLNHFGINKGISMFLASEIPPGTGLGSSSAVAVAVIKALSVACGLRLSQQEVAALACDIEVHKLGSPIGKQDQYAAAFGGLNFITFTSTGVCVERLQICPGFRQELEQHLMLFFTGEARDSGAILKEQSLASAREDSQVIGALRAVKELAHEMRACLESGHLRVFGELLHQGWEHKKKFAAGITKPFVDECYDTARSLGALGGKLTGAGGGGFLLLYCMPEYQKRISEALEARALRRLDFRFEEGGVRVLMNASPQMAATARCLA